MANISAGHRIPKASVKLVYRSMWTPKVCSEIHSRQFASVFLCVEPIKFVLQPNSVYHVNERDRLVLPCVAQGSPQPTITWFKVKRTLALDQQSITIDPNRIRWCWTKWERTLHSNTSKKAIMAPTYVKQRMYTQRRISPLWSSWKVSDGHVRAKERSASSLPLRYDTPSTIQCPIPTTIKTSPSLLGIGLWWWSISIFRHLVPRSEHEKALLEPTPCPSQQCHAIPSLRS